MYIGRPTLQFHHMIIITISFSFVNEELILVYIQSVVFVVKGCRIISRFLVELNFTLTHECMQQQTCDNIPMMN